MSWFHHEEKPAPPPPSSGEKPAEGQASQQPNTAPVEQLYNAVQTARAQAETSDPVAPEAQTPAAPVETPVAPSAVEAPTVPAAQPENFVMAHGGEVAAPQTAEHTAPENPQGDQLQSTLDALNPAPAIDPMNPSPAPNVEPGPSGLEPVASHDDEKKDDNLTISEPDISKSNLGEYESLVVNNNPDEGKPHEDEVEGPAENTEDEEVKHEAQQSEESDPEMAEFEQVLEQEIEAAEKEVEEAQHALDTKIQHRDELKVLKDADPDVKKGFLKFAQVRPDIVRKSSNNTSHSEDNDRDEALAA